MNVFESLSAECKRPSAAGKGFVVAPSKGLISRGKDKSHCCRAKPLQGAQTSSPIDHNGRNIAEDALKLPCARGAQIIMIYMLRITSY